MNSDLKIYTIQLDNMESFEDYLFWIEICITFTKEKALRYFMDIYNDKLEKTVIESKTLKKACDGTMHNNEYAYVRDIEELEHNIIDISIDRIKEYEIKEGYIGVL